MFRIRRILAGAVMIASIVACSHAERYLIDSNHSTILLQIKHLGISTVTGRFGKFSGTFEYDPKNPKGAKAAATIDAASIDTNLPLRDRHLRSAEFLDVKKYPTITFESTDVVDTGGGPLKLRGDLTLHGIRRAVTMELEPGGTAVDDRGLNRIGFTATTTINRTDYGLVWNRIVERGGTLAGKDIQIVGDEVRITLDMEGVQDTTRS